MNKHGKIALAQILILIVGIVAIGYALGSEVRVVSAAKTSNINLLSNSKVADKTIKDAEDTLKKFGEDPETTTDSGTSHGYAEEAWEWVTGEPIQVKTAAYSATGIIQGAGWALTVYGVIKMIGGFVDEEGAVTNALASGAAAGVFAGKS